MVYVLLLAVLETVAMTWNESLGAPKSRTFASSPARVITERAVVEPEERNGVAAPPVANKLSVYCLICPMVTLTVQVVQPGELGG